jgi:protein-S-isoprenylcysteine O-methyltransferase Ste14
MITGRSSTDERHFADYLQAQRPSRTPPNREDNIMRKTALLLYGVASYAVFFATFLYLIGFIGNLWVPKSIDAVPTMALVPALAIDLGLLGLFAVQHSVMARGFFKRWLTRYIPEAAERSTYVLASSLALILLAAFWQPLGGLVWQVSSPALTAALYALFAAGWLLVLVSTSLINHFDLFGLRQVWLAFRGRPYTPLTFAMPWLYRYVRHPIYLGFFIAMWATPTMTVTHLVFAVMASAYIVIGTMLEERDLRKVHAEYDAYAREVPRFVPRLSARRRAGYTHRAA